MKIVVVDCTGLIGAKTVGILGRGGEAVVAASRKDGVKPVAGEGLEEAMAEETYRSASRVQCPAGRPHGSSENLSARLFVTDRPIGPVQSSGLGWRRSR